MKQPHNFLLVACYSLLIWGYSGLIGCSADRSLVQGGGSKWSGLEEGWQLQVPPVSKLLAGTIYRQDSKGKVYRVTTLSVPAESVEEGGFAFKTMVRTTGNAIVQFLSIGEIGGELGKEVRVELEMNGIERQITDDHAVDQAMKELWDKVDVRPGEKYFVIREARAASRINMHLTHDVVMEIGGEVALNKMVGAGSTLKRSDQGSMVIQNDYEKRMYVLFLPEEIRVISAGLSGDPPKFGRFPVRRVLGWSLDPQE